MSHASLLRSNKDVERHLQLAKDIAFRYSRRTGFNVDDLRQVDLLGLIEASRIYRHHIRVPFKI